MGVKLQVFDVRKPEDLEPALTAASQQRADGLIVGQDGLFVAYRKQVTELAAKYRLPAIYRSMESIEYGALMAYGPNYSDIYRRAAIYVDKIFKGANPGDLPIEQPTKFELIHQPQDREGARHHHSEGHASARGRGDPVIN